MPAREPRVASYRSQGAVRQRVALGRLYEAAQPVNAPASIARTVPLAFSS